MLCALVYWLLRRLIGLAGGPQRSWVGADRCGRVGVPRHDAVMPSADATAECQVQIPTV